MKVLVTGAFGNIGRSTLDALLEHGHTVRAFDLNTPANRRIAHQLARKAGERLEVHWGDLRRPADIQSALPGIDVVIHLAFIIPKLSHTGVECERRPDWAWEINVGGTRNLLTAMQSMDQPPRLIFASSYHVYGKTQDQPPPRKVTDPVHPVEHYARHKLECEEMIRASGLTWAILRLSAAMPISLILDPGMFDVPLSNRMEFVHTRDVGEAFAHAVESQEIWGKTLLIGGGRRCQYYYREIVERILEGLGIGTLPAEAFSTEPFATDWVDTEESQRLLRYQRRTLDDYVEDVRKALGMRRHFIRLFRPVIRAWLLSRSPYWKARKRGAAGLPAPMANGR